MFINRLILKDIKKYKKSVLLLGPRQSGKSTLIQALKPELEINLANQQEFVRFLSHPGELQSRLKKQKTIFIDEVQRIPSLLNTIQYLIDQDKSRIFYLTGSSARKLRRGHANLLPGRIVTFELGPLCLEEIGEPEETSVLLQKGFLPGIYLETEKAVWQKVLRSYASTYLKEEIQAEALTRNLEGFSRFFEIMASRSGDFLDISKFSSLAEIERTSAKRYFEVLEDTLLVYSVEAFAKSPKRRLIQHPKYYFFDVGVLNGALNNFEVSPDRIGYLLEHLILQLIKSTFKALDQDHRVSVYRTEAGAEVDFIIEKGKKIFALEVKATRKINKQDLRGLKSFQEFHGGKVELLVAYLGEHSLEIDGISILPWQQALKQVTS